MASGMKLWIGLVVGGILLIAAWGLPPSSQVAWFGGFRSEGPIRLPERTAYMEVRRELLDENWLYQRVQWRDSLLSLVRASEEAGRRWSVALPPEAPERYVTGLEAAVEAQLSEGGVREPAVPVGSVLMDGTLGSFPGVRNPGYMSFYYREVFVGDAPEAAYCFLVDPILTEGRRLDADWSRMVWAPPDSSSPPMPLGPCVLHAEFGTPGPLILEWLANGGYRFALGSWTDQMELPATLSREATTARWAFGLRTGWWSLSPAGEACLAGKREGCLTAVLTGPSRANMGGSWPLPGGGVVARVYDYAFDLPFNQHEYTLLRDLEEEKGEDAFRAFWTSELPVEEAFLSTFGVPLADWVMEWARGRVGVVPSTPVVPLNASVFSLVLVMGFAGLAVFSGRRQR